MAERKTRLTDNKRRFAQFYVLYSNATRAYRESRADGKKLKDSTCAVEGHKLLKDPNVQTEIARIRLETEEEAFLTIKQKRQFLRDVAMTPPGAIDQNSHLCQEYTIEEGGNVRIKMPSKLAAIAEDNKMAGHLAADKLELTGRDGAPVDIRTRTIDEDEAFAEMLARKQKQIADEST